MEPSELNPEDQEKLELSNESDTNQSEENKIDDSSATFQNPVVKPLEEKENNNKVSNKEKSLFKRVLENGFDGITTNPNYKLLALLIILLINLSLFFLVGNLGKTFLKNSGILG